jgi:VanZ family protein
MAAPISPLIHRYLGAYSLLIVFGSLYSNAGWQLDNWSLGFLFDPLPPYITRTDISTNLLVYVPFGYLLALTLSQPQHRARAIFLTLLAGTAMSILLESLQGFLSDRISSNLDVSLNVLGTLGGALLTLHHHRWRRAVRWSRRWRQDWISPQPWASWGLVLLAVWVFTQFSLLPFPGAGWLGLHLRPFDTPPEGISQVNLPWFFAVFLEMAALGAFFACLLRPGRYVTATLLLFIFAFATKLVVATMLLKLRAAGGVLSLESLLGFLLAFWLLLSPPVSRHRRQAAMGLLGAVILLRAWQADYLLWPQASLFNIVGLAKAAASFWPYLALATLGMSFLYSSRPARPPSR